jgi:hypothetical protein
MIPVMVRVLKISTDSDPVLTHLNQWFTPNFHRTFTIPTFSLLNIYLFTYLFLFFHSCYSNKNFLKFWHFQKPGHLDLE